MAEYERIRAVELRPHHVGCRVEYTTVVTPDAEELGYGPMGSEITYRGRLLDVQNGMTMCRGWAAVDLAPDEGTPEVQSVLGGHVWVTFLADDDAPDPGEMAPAPDFTNTPEPSDAPKAPDTPPDTVICRHVTNGTTANGFDSLSSQLLERAGFQREYILSGCYYRLPSYGQSETRENAMATDAARMLRAAHYQVAIDPALDLDSNSGTHAAGWTCPIHPDTP